VAKLPQYNLETLLSMRRREVSEAEQLLHMASIEDAKLWQQKSTFAGDPRELDELEKEICTAHEKTVEAIDRLDRAKKNLAALEEHKAKRAKNGPV
jgi:hypothetical protein